MKSEKRLQRIININLVIVVIGLAVSGITAFPIQAELAWLVKTTGGSNSGMFLWLDKVYDAVATTNRHYPFLAYGTDWLAFAHLMLAILFAGIITEPVKNKWVVQFGIIACVMIIPLAFIAGRVRGIPFFWQLIDCSFGVICIVPLYIIYRCIDKLSKWQSDQPKYI